MSPDLADVLCISFIVSLSAIVLCPLLCWLLPSRREFTV